MTPSTLLNRLPRGLVQRLHLAEVGPRAPWAPPHTLITTGSLSTSIGDRLLQDSANGLSVLFHAADFSSNPGERAGDLVELLNALVKVSPIDRLELFLLHYFDEASLAALVSSPALRQVRELGLWADSLSADALAQFDFPELQALSISVPGVAGVRALAENRRMPRLSALRILRGRFGADGIDVLASSRLPELLDWQSLIGADLGDEGAVRLAALAPRLTLTLLALEYNGLGDRGATALLGAAWRQRLEQVNLRENKDVGDATLDALEHAPACQAVHTLMLANTSVTPAGIERLLQGSALPDLRYVGASVAVSARIAREYRDPQAAPRRPGLKLACPIGDATTFPVHDAAARGDRTEVQRCIEAGDSANLEDGRACTPLHHAVKSGSASLVALLLNAGAQVDARDVDGLTPLYVAVNAGDLETVRLLLEHGASPHAAPFGDSRSALAIAKRAPGLEMSRLFDAAIRKMATPASAAQSATPEPVRVGSSVRHPKFGEGNVVSVDGDKAAVRFADGTQRTLLVRVLAP